MPQNIPIDKIHLVSVDDLRGAEYNPRHATTKDMEDIKASILSIGFVDPIIVNKHPSRLNIIVGGHQRWYAAKELEFDEVPCVFVEYDEEKEKEANLRLNKNVAGWDWEVLADFDRDLLLDVGFTDLELVEHFQEEKNEIEEDDFDPGQVSDDVKVKLGELYRLGEHRLMCGDSTKIEDVEKLMNGEKADLFLTDPPYNVSYEGKTKDALKIDNDEMDDDDFHSFLQSAFFCADQVMKNGAVFYIWHADSEGFNFRSAVKKTGWKVRQCLIWNKNSLVLGRQDYHWKHEPCLYGWKDGGAHFWGNDRRQTTVLEFDRPSRNGEHPTMKPIELIAYQINNSSQRGGGVCT